MKFSPEFIVDSVKNAAREERKGDEGRLFTNLETILTPEAIEGGVEVKLGKRSEEFRALIEVLQLQDNSEGFQTWSALVSREANSVSSLGAFWLRDLVEQHGAAATLEYLHSLNWDIRDGVIKLVTTSATSMLLMTGVVSGGTPNETRDPDSMAIELSAYGNSTPFIDKSNDPDLSEFPEIRNMSNREGLNAFSQYILEEEVSVSLPRMHYAFRLGRIAATQWFTPAYIDAFTGIYTYDGSKLTKDQD